jgi:hypothetical protein
MRVSTRANYFFSFFGWHWGLNSRHDQNRTSPWHVIVKTISTVNKERILKTVQEKPQISYIDKTIKITADFSTETLQARKECNINRNKNKNQMIISIDA